MSVTTGRSAGAGYPLGRFWSGIEDPALHIRKLEPWRIQAIRGRPAQRSV
ncbi:hypothetical protein ACWF99_24830 [Nocardia sp. NPDC055002]